VGTGSAFPGFRTEAFSFEGTAIRYLEAGAGFPILLMHGVGPGTSCVGNFRFLLGPLARRFHVFAMDLAGFGLSGRKKAPPYFDFDLWTRQAQTMLDLMPNGPVGVLGHSLSGALALRLAACNSRIVRVLTTASVGTRYKLPKQLERLWTFPETREDLRAIMATIIYDVTKLTDEMLDERLSVLLHGDYRDYFNTMFGSDKQQLMDSWVLSEDELRRIAAPVLMIHGRNDAPCPAELTALKLAEYVPQADVLLLARCSHSPNVEYPAKILAATETLFGTAGTQQC
jgi:2-hydroxymuconate-semialdehyde hydrolase